jgi:hypothetical protein
LKLSSRAISSTYSVINANILLQVICLPSEFPWHFVTAALLTLAFQTSSPAFRSPLASSLSSWGLDALCRPLGDSLSATPTLTSWLIFSSYFLKIILTTCGLEKHQLVKYICTWNINIELKKHIFITRFHSMSAYYRKCKDGTGTCL